MTTPIVVSDRTARVAQSPYRYQTQDLIDAMTELGDPYLWGAFGEGRFHVIRTLYQNAIQRRIVIPHEFAAAIGDQTVVSLDLMNRKF